MQADAPDTLNRTGPQTPQSRGGGGGGGSRQNAGGSSRRSRGGETVASRATNATTWHDDIDDAEGSATLATPMSGTREEALSAMVVTASRRAQMVDLDALVHFVFPPELQHAMSTGRLLAFGFYGPLDAAAQLRSGPKGSHVVGRWELDTMCRQFEREDILQVYMPAGKSPSSLSEAEAEELLAQADSRLKVAKGKAMMEQITPDQVRGLFADMVERSLSANQSEGGGSGTEREKGLLNFHEMQHRIMEYRQACIERNKVIFPKLTGRGLGGRRGGGGGGSGGGSLASKNAQRMKKSFKVSADVAPGTMFLHDQGLNPMETATATNKMLSTKAFQICDIERGNDPGLTANVKLLRAPMTLPYTQKFGVDHASPWDAQCARRRANVGSFVKSAKSGTTAKRRTTLADHN